MIALLAVAGGVQRVLVPAAAGEGEDEHEAGQQPAGTRAGASSSDASKYPRRRCENEDQRWSSDVTSAAMPRMSGNANVVSIWMVVPSISSAGHSPLATRAAISSAAAPS